MNRLVAIVLTILTANLAHVSTDFNRLVLQERVLVMKTRTLAALAMSFALHQTI
jgi:hypothetical protein